MKKEDYIFAVFDKRESVIESWLKDAVTFGFMLLCIYVSSDSTWWTFATGCIFVLFLSTKALMANPRMKKFHSKKELQAWVNSQEDK